MAKKKAGQQQESIKQGPDITSIEEDVVEEKSTNIVNKIWDLFCSMRVGIILLLVLALASVIGTIIPQVPIEQIAGSPEYNKLYDTLGFYDLYHTFYFKIILFLLCMNLVICSLNRLKIMVKAFQPPKLVVTDKFMKSLAVKDVIKPKNAAPDKLAKAVTAAFKAKGYRVFTEQQEDKYYVAADKGNWGVWGSFMSHISFVVIVAGAIVGGMYGFDGDIAAPVGSTFNVYDVNNVANLNPDQNFQVRVDDFKYEKYENGAPKDYKSTLTVIDDNKEQFTKTIEVNDPLKYKGITMYQSYFGSNLTASITNKTNNSTQDYQIQEQGYTQVANTDYYVQVMQYIPNFDPKSSDYQGPADLKNPGVVFSVFKGNEQLLTTGTEFNKAVESGEISIKFTKQSSFTGLSVKKDPGVPVVWAGCGLLVLGTIVSFAIQHRKAWAVVSTAGAPVVELGAITQKNKLGLQNEFKDISENINRQFDAGVKGREI